MVFGLKGYHIIDYVVILETKIYGLKSAGLSCSHNLKYGIEIRDFICSAPYGTLNMVQEKMFTPILH